MDRKRFAECLLFLSEAVLSRFMIGDIVRVKDRDMFIGADPLGLVIYVRDAGDMQLVTVLFEETAMAVVFEAEDLILVSESPVEVVQ